MIAKFNTFMFKFSINTQPNRDLFLKLYQKHLHMDINSFLILGAQSLMFLFLRRILMHVGVLMMLLCE